VTIVTSQGPKSHKDHDKHKDLSVKNRGPEN